MRSPIATWLPAFEKARRTGKERLAALLARLAREAGCAGTAGVTDPASGDAPGASPAVRGSRKFAQLLAAMRRQRKLLEAAWAAGETPVAVVAIAMKRLSIISGHSARARLAELARPLPGSPDAAATAVLAASKPLLLFDPQDVSGEWARAEAYWDEGLFIVDYAFISYSAAVSPFRFAMEACRAVYAAARDLPSPGRRGLKPVVAAVLLLAAYRSLLPPGRRRIEAVFFTSNSFATEVLRTYLMKLPECARIHEILHGVPTREFEVYMRELFASAPAGGKHTFVPQLPGLDLYGSFAQNGGDVPRAGINAAVNRYFFDRPMGRGELAAWIDRECRAIGIDPAAPAPLLVAVPGASTIEPGYIGSPAWRVEQAMIVRARDTLIAAGAPFVLVYTPHPVYPRSLFELHRFFVDHGVVIYPDTIFTWLIADLTLGLYSSALFEAAYAGSQVFSPMREDDGLYPASLLDRLSHPGAGENWLDALSAFLHARAKAGGETSAARALRRIGRFVQVSNEDAPSAQPIRSVSSYV